MTHKFFMMFLLAGMTIPISSLAAPGDIYEPNNSFSAACPISVGDSVIKNAFVFGKDTLETDPSLFDVDYYKVILEVGKLLTITPFSWDTCCFRSMDLRFTLYDSSKSLVYGDYTYYDNPIYWPDGYKVSRSGTYYLKICNKINWPDTTIIKYGISIHQRDIGAITVTSPHGGETFSAGQVVSITWQADTSAHNLDIMCSWNNGATWKLIGQLGDGSFSWVVPLLKNATSRALVKVVAGNIGNLYGVSNGNFSIVPSPPDVYEPNDDFSSAYSIAIGDSVVKKARIGEIDTSDMGTPLFGLDTSVSTADNDYYKITLAARKFTTISSGFPTNEFGFPSVRLFDVLKNEIPLSLDLTCTITQPGTYYIVVSPYPEFWMEYNLSIHQSNSISNDLIHLISPIDEENFSTGQEVKVRWTADTMINQVNLHYSCDSGATWITISKVPSDSQYYSWIVPPLKQPTNKALVRIQASVDSTLYDVSKSPFIIQAITPDSYEPNNDVTSAYPIAIGDSVVKNATVCYYADIAGYHYDDPGSHDRDYYKVSLSAGKLTTINMFSMESPDIAWVGPIRPCLNLYNDSNEKVGYSDFYRQWKFCSTQSGIYYCEVIPGSLKRLVKYGISITSLTILSTQKSELDTIAYQKNSLAAGDSSQGAFKAQIVADTTKLTINLTTDVKDLLSFTTMILSPDELHLASNTRAKVKIISILNNYSSSAKTTDITIPYTISELNGEPESMLTAFWLDETTNQWQPVSSTIDTVKHQITVHGRSWCTYGIFVNSNTANSAAGAIAVSVHPTTMNYQPHLQSVAMHLSLMKASNTELRLYNIQGKCVKSGSFAARAGYSTFMWHLGALANGKYFLSMKAGTYNVKEPIVIMN
jgi:hypothetical protein